MTAASNAQRMWTWALLRTDWVNTHPVFTQVRFRVLANSPFKVGPQCATVSPLEESRFVLGLVPGLAYRDRRAQQRGRLRRRDATQRVLRPAGARYRRLSPDSSPATRAHLDRVSSVPEGQLPCRSRPSSCSRIEAARHFPTLTTRAPDL